MKTSIRTIATHRYFRFASVGVFNTLLDLVLFNIFLIASGNAGSKTVILICNTISATLVAIISFFLNRRFVFRSSDTPHHHAIYFIAVTLSGLYLVQNAIIYAMLHSFGGLATIGLNILSFIGITGISHQFLLVNVAKICATAGSMIWNYLWYSRVIFRTRTTSDPATEQADHLAK